MWQKDHTYFFCTKFCLRSLTASNDFKKYPQKSHSRKYLFCVENRKRLRKYSLLRSQKWVTTISKEQDNHLLQYKPGILALPRMTLGLWQVARWIWPTMCSIIRQTAYLATTGGVHWLVNKEMLVSPLASGAEAALGTCVELQGT